MEMVNQKAKAKSIKRSIIEWGITLGVIALFYFTGLHTVVSTQLQRAILWTNFFTPEQQLPSENLPLADYSFRLVSIDGTPATLKQFEGKTIFMNFWATWCPPCLAEMPGIHNLYSRVQETEDISFVMITVDDDLEAVHEYIANHEYTFPVYQVAGTVPPVFRSSLLPTTFVIAPNGRVVTHEEGISNYDSPSFESYLRDLASSGK